MHPVPAPRKETGENRSNGTAVYRSDGTGHDLGPAAPIVEVPRRIEGTRPRRPGWTSTDFVVVLLAVGVLALSVVGLFWLLRG